MKAAVVTELGRTPTVEELPEPTPGEGQSLIETGAVGLNPVDLTIADGTFYGGHPPLPFAAGMEAVGRVLESPAFAAGTRVYTLRSATGTLAERFVADTGATWELPEGDDDAIAVALGVVGLAGWVAVEERAQLRPGERVLILGATGAVGSVAVQAARLLGAGRIVAAGRSPQRLERARELGAHAVVELRPDSDIEQAFRQAFADGGPDVVIDPLWGAPGLAAIAAAPPNTRIVNLGQSAGAEISLTSAALRGKRLRLIGHSVMSTPPPELAPVHRTMIEHARAGRLTIDLAEYPLDRIAEAWDEQRPGPERKLVVTF
jgi:NADPH2:quinone reductase